MGNGEELQLSPEEEKELSVGLLREWWLTSIQAFVDNAGSEIALKHLFPHMKNAGTVGGNLHYRSNHHSDNCLKDAALGTVLWPNMIHEAEIEIRLGQHGATWKAKGCSTKGACKEACICFCQYGGGATLEEILRLEGLSPDYDWILTKSLSFGDMYCEMAFKERGQNLGEGLLEEIKPISFSYEEQLFWQLAIYGELWVISTKAFSDWASPDKASEILASYMRLSGLSVGNFLAKTFGSSSFGQATLRNVIATIFTAHGKKGNHLSGKDEVEQEITECPFSGSPKEICEQCESFFNGICEAVNPEHKFVYDRMMTRGDESCHWTIRKRDERHLVEDRKSSIKADLKLLTQRLVRGEITKEEYQEMKAILQGN